MKPCVLILYLTVQTNCFYTDWLSNCKTEVKSFDSKESLSDYLKSQYNPMIICEGPCVKVYEAKPIAYEIKIQTEEREKKMSERVETGRTITFSE